VEIRKQTEVERAAAKARNGQPPEITEQEFVEYLVEKIGWSEREARQWWNERQSGEKSKV
jgi:hypothetical protein